MSFSDRVTGTVLVGGLTLVGGVHGCGKDVPKTAEAATAQTQQSTVRMPEQAKIVKESGGYTGNVMAPDGRNLTLVFPPAKPAGSATAAIAKEREQCLVKDPAACAQK